MKKKEPITQFTYRGNRKLYEKNKGKIPAYVICIYCKVRSVNTWDHVIPYSYGGTENPMNLVPCCTPCNSMLGPLLFESCMEKKWYIQYRISWLNRQQAINKVEFRRQLTERQGSLNLLAWFCGISQEGI